MTTIAKKNAKMSRAVLVRRFGLRALRKLRQARRERTDGIEMVLLREHNARDEQAKLEPIAMAVAQTLRQRGLWAHVSSGEYEQMGGQHMEWVNHVTLTALRREPADVMDWQSMSVLRC